MSEMRDAAGGARPLSARSVIATSLLGAEVAEVRAAHLVRAGALFGIAEGAMRTALWRMAADGEVTAHDGWYRLAGPLLERKDRVDDGQAPVRRPWDGTWELAVVAAERRPAAERLALRAAAVALHLGEVREGTWARPANLASDRLPAQRAVLDAQCLHFTGAAAPDGLAARIFDLDGWARRANALVAAMDDADPSVPRPARRRPPTGPARAIRPAGRPGNDDVGRDGDGRQRDDGDGRDRDGDGVGRDGNAGRRVGRDRGANGGASVEGDRGAKGGRSVGRDRDVGRDRGANGGRSVEGDRDVGDGRDRDGDGVGRDGNAGRRVGRDRDVGRGGDGPEGGRDVGTLDRGLGRDVGGETDGWGDAGGDPAALAPGFTLSVAVVRHLEGDPQLPDELLPPDWPGPALRRRFVAYDRAYKRRFTAWLLAEG